MEVIWLAKLMDIADSAQDVLKDASDSPEIGLDFFKVHEIRYVTLIAMVSATSDSSHRLSLHTWKSKLPSAVFIASNNLGSVTATPQTYMINIMFHYVLMLLLRPFLPKHQGTSAPASAQATSTPATRLYLNERRDDIHRRLQDAAIEECPTAVVDIHRLTMAYRQRWSSRFMPPTALHIIRDTAITIGDMMPIAGGRPPVPNSNVVISDCARTLQEAGFSWTLDEKMLNLIQSVTKSHTTSAQIGPSSPSPPRVVRYSPPSGPPPQYAER